MFPRLRGSEARALTTPGGYFFEPEKMKRNFTDNLTRTTAGCLPVPLFNQKKRSRQPLTSNPQKNEPNSMDTFTDHFDFSPLSGDISWENRMPPVPHQEKPVNCGQTQHPTSYSQLQNQQNKPKSNMMYTEKNYKVNTWRSKGERENINKDSWNGNECMPLNKRTDLISDSEMLQGQMSTSHQQRPQFYKTSAQTRTVSEQKWPSTTTTWPNKSNTTASRPQNQKQSYTFKHNSQQTKVNEKTFQGETAQKVPTYQLKFNEKDNTLRIISAVIESMKHWSQYTDRAALLFEVLATLDSAVTSGTYGAKTFLLRDGRDALPCIFYETDRDLPRLIRGRIHRCMGNYDKKRNLFKCVSVRPASVAEQRTFPEFIKASDAEIKQYVKSMNEV